MSVGDFPDMRLMETIQPLVWCWVSHCDNNIEVYSTGASLNGKIGFLMNSRLLIVVVMRNSLM